MTSSNSLPDRLATATEELASLALKVGEKLAALGPLAEGGPAADPASADVLSARLVEIARYGEEFREASGRFDTLLAEAGFLGSPPTATTFAEFSPLGPASVPPLRAYDEHKIKSLIDVAIRALQQSSWASQKLKSRMTALYETALSRTNKGITGLELEELWSFIQEHTVGRYELLRGFYALCLLATVMPEVRVRKLEGIPPDVASADPDTMRMQRDVLLRLQLSSIPKAVHDAFIAAMNEGVEITLVDINFPRSDGVITPVQVIYGEHSAVFGKPRGEINWIKQSGPEAVSRDTNAGLGGVIAAAMAKTVAHAVLQLPYGGAAASVFAVGDLSDCEQCRLFYLVGHALAEQFGGAKGAILVPGVNTDVKHLNALRYGAEDATDQKIARYLFDTGFGYDNEARALAAFILAVRLVEEGGLKWRDMRVVVSGYDAVGARLALLAVEHAYGAGAKVVAIGNGSGSLINEYGIPVTILQAHAAAATAAEGGSYQLSLSPEERYAGTRLGIGEDLWGAPADVIFVIDPALPIGKVEAERILSARKAIPPLRIFELSDGVILDPADIFFRENGIEVVPWMFSEVEEAISDFFAGYGGKYRLRWIKESVARYLHEFYASTGEAADQRGMSLREAALVCFLERLYQAMAEEQGWPALSGGKLNEDDGPIPLVRSGGYPKRVPAASPGSIHSVDDREYHARLAAGKSLSPTKSDRAGDVENSAQLTAGPVGADPSVRPLVGAQFIALGDALIASGAFVYVIDGNTVRVEEALVHEEPRPVLEVIKGGLSKPEEAMPHEPEAMDPAPLSTVNSQPSTILFARSPAARVLSLVH